MSTSTYLFPHLSHLNLYFIQKAELLFSSISPVHMFIVEQHKQWANRENENFARFYPNIFHLQILSSLFGNIE